MNFQEIMREITSGLTGDSTADLAYLKSQMEKYQDHEMSQEILRACGRMMSEILPDDKKQELRKIIDNDLNAFKATLEEVRFCRYKKDPNKALKLIQGLVDQMEDMLEEGMFADDAVSEYHSFYEVFETVLYSFVNNPQKTLRDVGGFPVAPIYLEYGSLLIDLKRIDEAQRALEKAVKWNPVDCEIGFEYAETFKMQGDIQTFYELTLKRFRYAFRAKDVARCYRNLGYCFVEWERWQEAMACLMMSLQLERDSKAAQLELYYIEDRTKGKIKKPGVKELRKFSKKYGFPIGADHDVIAIAYTLGKKSAEEGNIPGARYFLQIAYELTEDDDFKKMIDDLPSASDR